jgi:hypothetical protein
MKPNFVIGFSAATLCWAVMILGFSVGDDRMPENLERDLQAYRQCIEDNHCLKDVEFYIQYYDIKWRLEDANLIR